MHLVFQYIEPKHKQFRELRYALRSWEKHYQGELEVIIVGECPSWINTKQVTYLPHKRADGIYRTNCHDQVSKMICALQYKDLSESFILTYDDIYLVNDITIDDLMPVYAVRDLTGVESWASTRHASLKQATIEALRQRGMTQWDCENHLPKLFNKVVMNEVINMYNPLDNRLLISTLYYNTFHPGQPIYLSRDDYTKAEYHGSNDKYGYHHGNVDDVRQVLKQKKFLNHNDSGLTDALKQVIKEMYSKPCRWEL